MTTVLPLLVGSGLLAAPFLFPATRTAPVPSASLWLAALFYRAAVVVGASVAAVAVLPENGDFSEISDWFLHTVVPFFATHLGIEGHALGHVAAVVPLGGILAFAAITAFRSWRADRDVHAWLSRSSLGDGPGGSHVVGGERIVLATAGIVQPQVFVSMGALLALDERELNAGIEHERAHANRSHGVISACGALLAAAAAPLPGTAASLGRLHYSLERDADEQATRITGDSGGLACAIRAATVGVDNRVRSPDASSRIQALDGKARCDGAADLVARVLTATLVLCGCAALSLALSVLL